MGHGFEFKKESYEHEHHSSGHGPHGHSLGYGHATSRPSHYGNSGMPVGQGYHQQGGYNTQNLLGHNNKHNQYLGHNGSNHGFLGQTMPMPCPPNGNMGWSSHGGQFNNSNPMGGMRHGGGGGNGFFEKKESAYEESRWSSGHGGGRMAGSNTMMHGGGGGYPAAEWVSKGL